MDILARIEEVIKQRGTNKAEVSEKMGKAKQNFKSLMTNPKWDSLELVCQAIGIEPWQLFEQEIMAAGYRLTAEPEPSATNQPQENDVEELSYQDGQQQEGQQQMRMHLRGIGDIDAAMPPAPPEKPAASEQPQGTTLVGLVRCPQCGHSIRLFAEE